MASAGRHGEFSAFGFALVVPDADVEKVGAVIESHRAFMNETHSVNGDMKTRLNCTQ